MAALTCIYSYFAEDIVYMNFREELKRFKPSLDVDDIEDAIMKMDLTDMNDIMFKMISETSQAKKTGNNEQKP